MLAGAILFIGAVGLLAVTVFLSHRWPDPDTQPGSFFFSLVAYATGVFAFFLIISGVLADRRSPPPERP